MPLAILIFNDNDYAVEVDALSIQLICDNERLRTLSPGEVVSRLYGKNNPLTGQPASKPANKNALDDFENKFLSRKPVSAHGKGGGFIYLPVQAGRNPASYLSAASVYIPNVYRKDTDSRLVFFEINLKAALSAVRSGQSGDSHHGSSRP